MVLAFVQSLVDGLLMGGVYALAALGVSLIFGVMKITNFAHGALMTVGMYATYEICTLAGASPYLILPAVIVIMFAIGYAIQKFVLNPIIEAPSHNQLLLTLGLSIVIENLLLLIFSANYKNIKFAGATRAFHLGSLVINEPKLMAFLIVSIAAVGIWLLLNRTDLGRAIRATSVQRDGATLMGIRVSKINAVAFGIGVACAGLAGALLTTIQTITPTSGESYQLFCFVIAVFGGLGNIAGAIVAGLIIGVVEAMASLYLGGSWSQMVVYLIFVLILFLKPTGLFGKKG